MGLKILIADDEPLAREGLRALLDGDREVEAVWEARNGREAIAIIQGQRPDLVFLDVQMPRMDGFAVVESLGADRMPAVIFVTAHDRYAIRAFDICAVDYLLKPVTEGRLEIAFRRAKDRLRSTPSDEAMRQLASVLDTIANPRRPLTQLAVRSGERTVFVPIDEVDWIDAMQNYVRLHTCDKTHLVHVPMNTLEAALDPACFARIHRSHIVNLKRIKQVWSSNHGQYIVELISGIRLRSGRMFSDRIRSLLANPF